MPNEHPHIDLMMEAELFEDEEIDTDYAESPLSPYEMRELINEELKTLKWGIPDILYHVQYSATVDGLDLSHPAIFAMVTIVESNTAYRWDDCERRWMEEEVEW